MDFLNTIEQMPLSIWVRESGSIWAFPTMLFLHTFGMAVVAGSNTFIDLVLLGFWPHAPIRPLERLYPMMWAGFWLNAITGTVLLMADAVSKLSSPDFYIKLVFIFAGAFVLARMRTQVFRDPQLDHGRLPAGAKMLAWASIVCWMGAIVAGRLLAYVGPVGGAR